MARRLCQFLLLLVVLYGLAVGAYALFGYRGDRPDVVTVASDLHGWVRNLLRYKYEPQGGAPAQGEIPPRQDVPPPAPVPAVPAVKKDARTEAVERVSLELLPRAKQLVKELEDRSSPDFEAHRTSALVALNQARDLLGPYLDNGQGDAEMQRLYKQVSELLAAVRKR